jgi:NADH dehydrogenase
MRDRGGRRAARTDREQATSQATAGTESGRILITGANGHLGRRLITRLAGAGRPVRAVVRSERAAETVRALPVQGDVELAVLDYRDPDAMGAAAAGCTGAVHLVGILLEGRGNSYRDAHEATCQALCAATAGSSVARVVYLSIVGAHPDSANACLASKGRAEAILVAGATPALTLRVPMVLGPGDYATRALAAQARARFVPLLRGGASLEQPIDAEDVVSAVLAGLERPGLDDVGLDLAGPECLTRRQLTERAAALHGRRPTVVPVPRWAMLALAGLLEALLPSPPLSRAMVGVLDHDDRVETAEALRRLGIELTALDTTLERYVGPGADS